VNNFMGSVVTIAGLLVGAAIVATIVSPKAKTSQVIGASFSGFASALGTALSPVTGASNFGMGSQSYMSF
jgi:hypothetical protein